MALIGRSLVGWTIPIGVVIRRGMSQGAALVRRLVQGLVQGLVERLVQIVAQRRVQSCHKH